MAWGRAFQEGVRNSLEYTTTRDPFLEGQPSNRHRQHVPRRCYRQWLGWIAYFEITHQCCLLRKDKKAVQWTSVKIFPRQFRRPRASLSIGSRFNEQIKVQIITDEHNLLPRGKRYSNSCKRFSAYCRLASERPPRSKALR